MSSRVFTLLCAMIASTFLAGSPNLVSGQESGSLFELVGTRSGSDQAEDCFVAVMGEVERPGTYRLDRSSLTLHKVVQCAQGFRDHASMAIRVIRRGRFSQIEIFSDKTDSRVWPGDLLIVESKHSEKFHSKMAGVDEQPTDITRADYYESDRPAVIQIALVNLMEYPVVLRLHPDQANASGLLQALDQPLALLARTHVITPDVPYRQSSDAAKKASRMQNGSVMVFEPDDVRRRQIAGKLPLPIDRTQTVATGTGTDTLHRSDRQSFRQTAQNSLDDRFDTINSDRDNQSDVILIPCDQLSPDSRFSEQQEKAVFGQFKPAFAAKLSESSMDDATPLIPRLDDLPSASHDASLPIADGLTTDEEIGPQEPERSFGHLFIILLAVGTLVCAALLLRHSLETMALKDQQVPDLIELLQKRPALKPLSEQDVDPTIPRRLLSDQPRVPAEKIEFLTEPALDASFAESSDARPDILQMQKNKLALAVAASQLARKSTTLSAEKDQPAELSTIPFRSKEEITLKLRPGVDQDSPSDRASQTNSDSETPVHPTPVATALFQLENKRQS